MRARIQLPGANALVTGAGSGIGRETALTLARTGTNVVCVDLDEVTAKSTAAACSDLGVRSLACQADVADRDSLVDVRARLDREWSEPVDLLVNNAGVGMTGRFLDGDPEDWDWIRSINLDGVVHGCQVFVPPMLERGRGHVVNVSSGLAVAPFSMTAAYSTTKAGVLMFSRAVRPDWGARGVGVSVILPGVINTNIIADTRFSGAIGHRRARSLAALGFQMGHSPRIVARAIARAVERNRAIVPAGFESTLGWYLAKVLPQPLAAAIGRPLPEGVGRLLGRQEP